jgi:hypothetical protein
MVNIAYSPRGSCGRRIKTAVINFNHRDIVKNSKAETAPKNKAAQRLIKIIEHPILVADEDVGSLIFPLTITGGSK